MCILVLTQYTITNVTDTTYRQSARQHSAMQFSRGKKYCLGIISCSVAYLDFIKEGRGAVGVNGGGRVAHPSPEIIFVPKVISLSAF